MNYSKADVLKAEATMNQMRNAIYHLTRFMQKNGKTDQIKRLRRMGRNIARTIFNYWKPISMVTAVNVKDVISTIYKKIFISNVVIEIKDDLISVKENNCALCKYQYEDVNIAGCEITLGLVSEFISLISKKSKDMASIYLEPYKIEQSKALGHTSCIQVYQIKSGGN